MKIKCIQNSGDKEAKEKNTVRGMKSKGHLGRRSVGEMNKIY